MTHAERTFEVGGIPEASKRSLAASSFPIYRQGDIREELVNLPAAGPGKGGLESSKHSRIWPSKGGHRDTNGRESTYLRR